jgi:hypothetical protein
VKCACGYEGDDFIDYAVLTYEGYTDRDGLPAHYLTDYITIHAHSK